MSMKVVVLAVLSATLPPSHAAFLHARPTVVSSQTSAASETHHHHLRSTAAPSTDDTVTNAGGVVGEADRSFRQGIQFEKFGQARAAAAAFHEAATLYQCFLDQVENIEPSAGGGDAESSSLAADPNAANAFGHVTGLHPEGPNSCRNVLAYACVRLAHLSHDALGDSKAATRLYREAATIDPLPSSISYDGIGTSIEGSDGSLADAAEAYREAHRLSPSNAWIVFHLAVALERLGELDESEKMMEDLRRSEAKHSCLVDSWGYVRWHTRKEPRVNLHRGTRSMLQIGLDAAQRMIQQDNGLVCEFGVGGGRSIRMIQEILPLGVPIHGFDTFTGLPQAWGDEPAGSYSTGGMIPNIEGEVYFHKGLFSESIPAFLQHQDAYQPLAFANVDCDLYGSTLDILESMHSQIVPGTVLVFDEYLCHPTWRQDEFRAWRECCKRFGWQYRYLAFSLSTKQAVVQVTQ